MTRERLSVVIPALNEARRLPGLLASLRAPAPDEIVVVDGGSRDGTVGVARAGGARVVSSAPGRGVQLRRGAAEARGDLLLFLHADMRVVPGALAELRRAFEGTDLVASGMRQHIDQPRRIYRWIEGFANRRVRHGWIYGDSGLAVRRSAYEAAGGFRELPIFEDLDLSRRLRGRGRIELVDGAQVWVSARRWERDGAIKRTALNWCLTMAWLAGVDPHRLVRYYPSQEEVAEES